MKKPILSAVLAIAVGLGVGLPLSWALYELPLLFVIPALPPFQPAYLSSKMWGSIAGITLDSEINRGVYFGKDNQSFYWTWYGLQNVAIVYWAYRPHEECAIHVEWTNGLETCLNAPSIAEEEKSGS